MCHVWNMTNYLWNVINNAKIQISTYKYDVCYMYVYTHTHTNSEKDTLASYSFLFFSNIYHEQVL